MTQTSGYNTYYVKEDSLNKESYQPVSIMSHLSKLFERIMCKQINNFIERKFSPELCGFRKNQKAQYLLLKVLENFDSPIICVCKKAGQKLSSVIDNWSKCFLLDI